MAEIWPMLESERCMRAAAPASQSLNALSRSPSASTGTTRSLVSIICTAGDWNRPAAAMGGWRVTGCPKKPPHSPLSQRLHGSRVARDSATALSQESSTSALS